MISKVGRVFAGRLALIIAFSLLSLTGQAFTDIAVREQAGGEPFCGMQFAMGNDLTTIETLGVTVVLQTFHHDDTPEEWMAQLDLAQSHNLQVVGRLWPEGWDWNGAVWHIDDQARLFVQTVASHPATLAVYALHEPFWRGCRSCGLTTAQQQVLYRKLKAMANVPIYSELGDIAFWANRGQETTLADGVCDYCGAWFYPAFADGSFHRQEFIAHLEDNIAIIRELAPASKLVWLMQVYAKENHRRMPTFEEIRDMGSIVATKDVDGIFWYVWQFGPLYSDFLSNHPELYPAVRNVPFCAGTQSPSASAVPSETPLRLVATSSAIPVETRTGSVATSSAKSSYPTSHSQVDAERDSDEICGGAIAVGLLLLGGLIALFYARNG